MQADRIGSGEGEQHAGRLRCRHWQLVKIVVDCSGSMEGDSIAEAKKAPTIQ